MNTAPESSSLLKAAAQAASALGAERPGGRARSCSSGLAAQTEGGRCGLLCCLEGCEILIFALQILPEASSGLQAGSGDFLFSQAW